MQECRRYIERGHDGYSPDLLTLLDARIKVCEETLSALKFNLSDLTPELTPKWDKLVSLLRSLAGCNARSKVSIEFRLFVAADVVQFPNEEVDQYYKELLQVQEELKEVGIVASESTGSTEDRLAEMTEKMQLSNEQTNQAPDAKSLIAHLLRRNLLWVALIKEKSVSLMFVMESFSNYV